MIETARLRLRPFAPDDTPAIYRLSLEDSWQRWLPSQLYRDESHARSVLDFLIEQFESPGDPRLGACVFAVDHRESGALIGHVGFSPFEGEVEIGFSIGEAYQRRGLAAEAITAASEWVMREFGLQRIVAIAAAENVASRQSLLRSGFVHSGDTVREFQGEVRAVSHFILEPVAG